VHSDTTGGRAIARLSIKGKGFMKEVYCKNCHHPEKDHLNPGLGNKYLPCRGELTIEGKHGEKEFPIGSYDCGCLDFQPGKVIERE